MDFRARAGEASVEPPLVATEWGKYTPFARLGNGGMADVFLAVARGPLGFNKLAVLKRLRNSEEDAHVRMFLDEARLAARLNHPNIVHTYDVGEVDGQFFIAMEYLDGQSVRQLTGELDARNEGLSETMVAFVASLALKGLHHAHELCDYDGTPLGVVHRDVSPQNLFVTYSGEVKLLDFGIAKATVNASQTDDGILKGKVQYMAPEQVRGGPVDRRLDVFAFGVVMWELLARRRLFDGDTIAVLTRIVSHECPSLRTVRPEVSPRMDAVVMRALRPAADERYPTAEAMRVELQALLRGHDPGSLERELASRMNTLFAQRRDAVRARVKTFLAKVVPIEDTQADLRAVPASELPPLIGSDRTLPMGGPSSSSQVFPSGPSSSPASGTRGTRVAARSPWQDSGPRATSFPPIDQSVRPGPRPARRFGWIVVGAALCALTVVVVRYIALEPPPVDVTVVPSPPPPVVAAPPLASSPVAAPPLAPSSFSAPTPSAPSVAPSARGPDANAAPRWTAAPIRAHEGAPRAASPLPSPPSSPSVAGVPTASAPATARPKIRVLDDSDSP